MTPVTRTSMSTRPEFRIKNYSASANAPQRAARGMEEQKNVVVRTADTKSLRSARRAKGCDGDIPDHGYMPVLQLTRELVLANERLAALLGVGDRAF